MVNNVKSVVYGERADYLKCGSTEKESRYEANGSENIEDRSYREKFGGIMLFRSDCFVLGCGNSELQHEPCGIYVHVGESSSVGGIKNPIHVDGYGSY